MKGSAKRGLARHAPKTAAAKEHGRSFEAAAVPASGAAGTPQTVGTRLRRSPTTLIRMAMATGIPPSPWRSAVKSRRATSPTTKTVAIRTRMPTPGKRNGSPLRPPAATTTTTATAANQEIGARRFTRNVGVRLTFVRKCPHPPTSLPVAVSTTKSIVTAPGRVPAQSARLLMVRHAAAASRRQDVMG